MNFLIRLTVLEIIELRFVPYLKWNMFKDPLLLLMPYPRYFYIPDTFMFAICDANCDSCSVILILLGSLTLKS